MTDFDKRMTFTLNKNDRKTEDWHADYRGTLIMDDGAEYYLDAKLRDGKSGKFFSGKVKPKAETKGPDRPAVKSSPFELDDEIPFA